MKTISAIFVFAASSFAAPMFAQHPAPIGGYPVAPSASVPTNPVSHGAPYQYQQPPSSLPRDIETRNTRNTRNTREAANKYVLIENPYNSDHVKNSVQPDVGDTPIRASISVEAEKAQIEAQIKSVQDAKDENGRQLTEIFGNMRRLMDLCNKDKPSFITIACWANRPRLKKILEQYGQFESRDSRYRYALSKLSTKLEKLENANLQTVNE